MIRFYAYIGCDSCRKARKWLLSHNVDFTELPIREQPPTLSELQQALDTKATIKLLFNTSGLDYRKMGMKDKLPLLSNDEALELLANHGNLIKRPFLIGPNVSLVGFKETEWLDSLAKLAT